MRTVLVVGQYGGSEGVVEMLGWNECSIYDLDCKEKTCDHPTNKSRKVVPMDEFITIRSMNGVKFTVVYGLRKYANGTLASAPTVAFYDRRYSGHTQYGQFVGENNREILLERQKGYGLTLSSGEPDWVIDASTMYVVMAWLNHMAWQEEN